MANYFSVSELINGVNNGDTHPSILEFQDDNVEDLATFLKENKTAISISIARDRLYSIREDNIDYKGAIAIAEALKTNTTLRELNICTYKIGDIGATAIAEALKTNTTLTEIELDHNRINENGAAAITEALKINTTITSISVHDNKWGSNNYNHKFPEYSEKNRPIRDALSDYAKTILGAKLIQAIDRDSEIYAIAKNNLNLELLTEEPTYQAINLLYKDLSHKDIINFSNAWHSPLQQEKRLSVKDFNGTEWPSLFGKKEIEIPEGFSKDYSEDISEYYSEDYSEDIYEDYSEDIYEDYSEDISEDYSKPSGYKLVARTTTAELKEEGKILNHCVGGYTDRCITGNTHIISVVNPDGKPISTIEYKTNQNQSIESVQHYGPRNSQPRQESVAAQKWFERQVRSKNINIDYKGLEEARKNRVRIAKTFEHKATLELGFNPLDKHKFNEVVKVFRDMADTTTKGIAAKGDNPAIEPVPQFRKNFDALLNLKEITLDTPIEGKTTFSLVEPKKVIERAKGAEGSKAIKQADIDAKTIQNLQANFDKIFGENEVLVSIVDKTRENKHGHVMLSPQEGVDPSNRLKNHPILKDKFEKTEGGYKSKPSPLSINKMLEGNKPPQKSLQAPKEHGL